nr:hypothetical protein Iba_chr06aCG12920 [Ipomoea batatas]
MYSSDACSARQNPGEQCRQMGFRIIQQEYIIRDLCHPTVIRIHTGGVRAGGVEVDRLGVGRAKADRGGIVGVDGGGSGCGLGDSGLLGLDGRSSGSTAVARGAVSPVGCSGSTATAGRLSGLPATSAAD